ncbi:MAG: hypothetical protein HN333_01370, partial [Rhodospirillaceae bacterium]|nr:hypothetical protein [Rhodospirillaceae bacterium]
MLKQIVAAIVALIGALNLALPALAGEADVVKAEARRGAEESYHFSVTLRHDDEGWDHYADKWDVVAPDGTI